MEFPTINLDDVENLKKKVRLELCKPDKSTIGILKSAYNIQVSIKAMSINVLEFRMPLNVDHYGQLIDNPHISDMRPYYLIRLIIGNNYEEYYRIIKPKDEGGEEDYKSYHCLSYIDTLSDRQLTSYSVTSYTIDEVLNGKPSEGMQGILSHTNWKVKYISPAFTLRYRSVDSGSTNILSFILDNIVNAYNCLPIFDTRTNEVSIYSPEEIGKDLGFTLSHRKYIESLGLELDPTSEFTTRLYAQGKDGLGIQGVTPTGQNCLEDYNYFMYPFSRYPTASRYESTQEDFATGNLVDVEATEDNTLKLVSGKTEGYRIWSELDLSNAEVAQNSVVNYTIKNCNTLYADGREFVNWVEGYSERDGYQSKEVDHLYLEVDNTEGLRKYAVRSFVTDEPIDFTNINQVFVDWEAPVYAEGLYNLKISKDKIVTPMLDYIEAHQFSRKISVVNTSNISGLNYIMVSANEWTNLGFPASKLYVYRIGLGDGTNIKWIDVESSTDNGSTWHPVNNNSLIPGINKNDELTGKKLLIKSEFYSNDPNDSPELEDLFVAVRGKETQSSNYFSDELCHAQLDYQEKLDVYNGKFEGFLADKEALQTTRAGLETDAFNLLNQLHIIEDRLAILYGLENAYHRYDFTYNGSTITKTSELNSEDKYMVMAKVSSTTDLTVNLDGSTKAMQSNIWEVLGKISNKTSSNVELSGSVTGVDVIIILAKITDDEFNVSENETELIERYCEPKKQDEYNTKVAEIDAIDGQISLVDADINLLRQELSLETNFTQELIEERNRYIIEKTYSNPHITDSKTLLEESLKFFQDINEPPLILDLDVINFLDCAEAYHDYDKLFYSALEAGLYDKLRVRYEPHSIDVKCTITEINLDVENSTLGFVVSNVREVLTEDEKMLKDFYKTSGAASTLLQEKYKWDGIDDANTKINQILNEVWDVATRSLRGGTNNSVEFGRFGLKITDPSNPLYVILMNNNYIGISADGGNTFKTVISAEGIAAKQLIGQIVLTAHLHIINAGGNIEFKEDGMKVYDQEEKLRLHIGNINVEENRYGLRLLDSTGTQSILDDRGLLQSWSDSMADNVDATHKLKMKFYIPDETISIRKLKLNFSLEPFRAYSTGAASGGGQTTSSGGGQTSSAGSSHAHSVSGQTASATGSHSHSISGQTAQSSGAHSHAWASYYQSSDSSPQRGYRTNTSGGAVVIGVHTNSTEQLRTYEGGLHEHTVTGATSSTVDSHSHSVTAQTSSSESSHTHTVANHTHSVSDHEHNITYGIYESTTATGVDVYVNGTKRLGPYTTNQQNLDLTQWIATGWNEIQLSSTKLGRINCSYFAQVFLGV